MKHEVKLIFGYDGYCGDITVSPHDMLVFLREPFARWLYKETWERPHYKIKGFTEDEFHRYVFESTSHFNDEYFYFDPKDAEWLGFRVDLEQRDSEVEFVFTTDTINGQIRSDFDKISMNAIDKLIGIKRTINSIVENSKYRKA